MLGRGDILFEFSKKMALIWENSIVVLTSTHARSANTGHNKISRCNFMPKSLTPGVDSSSHHRVDGCNKPSLSLATISHLQTARFWKMNLDKQHGIEFVIFTVFLNSFNFLHFSEEEHFLCELQQGSANPLSVIRYI